MASASTQSGTPLKGDPHQIVTVKEVLEDPNMPKNGKMIATLLSGLGVERFEKRVIHQLLEFTHRFSCEVLEDATRYKDHAGKAQFDLDDVRLAAQSRVNYSFTQPPPREFLIELAQKKNVMALPLTPSKPGVHLPPPEECVLNANYRVGANAEEHSS